MDRIRLGISGYFSQPYLRPLQPKTPLVLTRDPSPAGGWLQFLVDLPQFRQVVLEDHATPPSAPAPFRHQTGTPVMPASLSHQVLNLTASPSSAAGISPHLGTLPRARTKASTTPWGRNVHGSTPNTPPDTYVLKIFPKVETAGSNPVGTVPREASGASSVNWPHPGFPSSYMLVATERPPGCHCSHSLCSSWWSSKKPAAGDSLIPGEFLMPPERSTSLTASKLVVL